MSEVFADQLEAVADIVERGWYQGSYAPPGVVDGQELVDGPMCLSAAVSAATGVPLRWRAKDEKWIPDFKDRMAMPGMRLLRHIEDHVGFRLITDWNDEPGRTQAEVVDTLRAMAKEARS